jgi:hypothetical protein
VSVVDHACHCPSTAVKHAHLFGCVGESSAVWKEGVGAAANNDLSFCKDYSS